MRTDAENWDKLWNELGAQGKGWPVYAELVSLYGQPGRYYHNLKHVTECLLELDRARSLLQAPAEVEAAIWFHDAIYDAHSSTNEEDSANLAVARLTESRVDLTRVGQIRQLVLATKAHEPTAPDTAVLIDIDLAILGQPPARFWEYERAIRAEYAWVPEEAFARGRTEILTRFLQRPMIYRTEWFHGRYEATAHANLTDAIAQLRATLK